MFTLDSILPTLKDNEKVMSQNASEGDYFRFTMGFSHFFHGVVKNEFTVQFDNEHIWIRYDFEEWDAWARKAIDSFLERLKETIKMHPEVKFRAVTGAIKLHVDPVYEIDDYGQSTGKDSIPTSSELIVFFIGCLMAFASVFELTTFLHVNLIGYMVITGLGFLVLLTAGIKVWVEDKKTWKKSEFWLFGLLGFLAIIGFTIVFAGVLAISLIISWILPFWLTVPAFLLCLLSFKTVVRWYEMSTEKTKKKTAKA